MVNRSLVTEEELNPLIVQREITVPIIYGVVGTQDATASHTAGVPVMTKTNDVSFGPLDGASTIPIVLAALNLYGIGDVVVVPVAAGDLDDGWAILAQDGRATHMAGEDADYVIDTNPDPDVATAAVSPLVTAKVAAAEVLQGIVALNAPKIGGTVADNITGVKAWAVSNASGRAVGTYAGGAVTPLFRATGNWTMKGAAAMVMGAIATNPFYQHPEYLPVLGIASTETNLKFAPRDAAADSEVLKFANLMPVIRTQGRYYTWGKSLMQNPATEDQKKYVEVRGVSDHYERFIDQSYLENIRAPSKSELHRLVCADLVIESRRLADLGAIQSATCAPDNNVPANQVGFEVNFFKEHPYDSVKVTKVINIS